MAHVRQSLKRWLPPTSKWTTEQWLQLFNKVGDAGFGESVDTELKHESVWGVRLITVMNVEYVRNHDINTPFRNCDIVIEAVLEELKHDIVKLASKADFGVATINGKQYFYHEKVVPKAHILLHSPNAKLRNLAGLDRDKLGDSFYTVKQIAETIPGRVRRFRFFGGEK